MTLQWDGADNGPGAQPGDGIWNLTLQNWLVPGSDPVEGGSRPPIVNNAEVNRAFVQGDDVSFGPQIGGVPYTVTIDTGGTDLAVSDLILQPFTQVSIISANGEGFSGINSLLLQSGSALDIGVDVDGDISVGSAAAFGFNGTLILSGNVTTAGSVTANEGTLSITGQLSTASSLTIAAAATLTGTGQILPSADINGSYNGTLTFETDIFLTASSVLQGGTVHGSNTLNFIDIRSATLTQAEIAAGGGNDFIAFSGSTHIGARVFGQAGDDTFIIGGVVDAGILGGQGADSIDLSGATVNRAIKGGAGSDTVTGSDTGESIYGNGGDDSLAGFGGDDRLFGGAGNDTLDGWGDNDRLDGGAGRDALLGGDGADRLIGGTGADTLTGGAGADDFIFVTIADLASDRRLDQITDFEQGPDRIDLRRIDADTGTVDDDRFAWIGNDSFSGTAGELRFYATSGRTGLQGDVDGDGIADFELRLAGSVPLTTDDIML
ncbi:MAG: M10 family metallopeptidase C-terminal domain-containing protein [Pseudomonadota bacterium]